MNKDDEVKKEKYNGFENDIFVIKPYEEKSIDVQLIYIKKEEESKD